MGKAITILEYYSKNREREREMERAIKPWRHKTNAFNFSWKCHCRARNIGCLLTKLLNETFYRLLCVPCCVLIVKKKHFISRSIVCLLTHSFTHSLTARTKSNENRVLSKQIVFVTSISLNFWINGLFIPTLSNSFMDENNNFASKQKTAPFAIELSLSSLKAFKIFVTTPNVNLGNVQLRDK